MLKPSKLRSMDFQSITVSSEFKNSARGAIGAIILFMVTYLVLFSSALVLAGFCGYWGLFLIASHPHFMTLLVGAGIISMGLIILVFLVKFIFKTNQRDRSHLVEITESEQPKLFAFIREIVNQAGTKFPKKIFVSSEVNAAVFYDSSFWSMFLPVRKNLIIGMGLVNSVSDIELKAILAHEFGHFSQRSMKVGSYVYNTNQIIFNIVNDDASFYELLDRWASIHILITIFVMAAAKVMEFIRFILRKMYEIVNISYLKLSRQMEFHADEVAANIAGSQPMINSLLRLDLANYAYNSVIDFYNVRFNDALISKNLFPHQQFVLGFLAKQSDLPIVNDLPEVSVENLSRFNKSKLNLDKQWESHPATEERVEALKKLNIQVNNPHPKPASDLFSDIESLQKLITYNVFNGVEYSKKTSYVENDTFINDYAKDYEVNSFGKAYNNYYDNKNPVVFDLNKASNLTLDSTIDMPGLFGNKQIDMVYTAIAIQNDLDIIKKIVSSEIKYKWFEYDGIKYKSNKSRYLIEQLQLELDKLNEEIQTNDMMIYRYFLNQSKSHGNEGFLDKKYQTYFKINKMYDELAGIHSQMLEELSFTQQTTAFEVIRSNFLKLKTTEETFKSQIRILLETDEFNKEITDEIKADFEKYLSKEWIYFISNNYIQDAIDLVYNAIGAYALVLNKTFFNTKKDLLAFQLSQLN
jgi:Zn-dependent protease with chaperone function